MRWGFRKPVATQIEQTVRWMVAALITVATVANIVFLIVVLSSGVLGPQHPLRNIPWLFVLMGTIAATGAAWCLGVWAENRGRNAAIQSRFRIGPGCRYPLAGLAETGTCPECSRGYTHYGLRELWTRRYGIDASETA